MNLIRWNALPEISILQREMNRLFQDASQNWSGDFNSASGWMPATDIYEMDNSVVVQIDLPGINPKDIDVVIENNVLTIRGERGFEAKISSEALHRMERSYGKFARSFALPVSVDAQHVDATYKNGVLTLSIAKAEHARPKRIQIAANAA
jgi:HSP20 family protein